MVQTRMKSGAGKRVDYAKLAGKKPRAAAAKAKGQTMAKEVTKIVNKVLDRKVEDKHIIFRLDDLTGHNSAISVPGDVVPLVQQIAVGTGSEGRIGDRITPKSLRVDGIVSLDDPDAILQYEPLTVRIVAYRQNDVNVGSANANVDTSSLFRDTQGGTGARGFTGIPSDLLVPLNDDKFRKLFDRQFTLYPQVTAAGAALVPMPGYQRKYSFRVKLPKQFKFDNATGDWPNNFAPFMSIGYAYAGSRAPDTVSTVIRHTAVAHLVYEDA